MPAFAALQSFIMKHPREWGRLEQVLSILVALGVLLGGFFSILIYAAEKKMDDKFATDTELNSVRDQINDNHMIVSQELAQVSDDLHIVSDALNDTKTSTDSLTLVVLDIQIDRAEEDIAVMQQSRQRAGDAWSMEQDRYLRQRQHQLDDLNIQRQALFNRIMQSNDRD